MAPKMMLITLVVLLGVASTQAQSRPRRMRGTQGPGLPCDGSECEATWTKCAGKGFDAISPCCPGDICVMKSSLYAQCRPESYPIPSGWEGSILDCGGGMGTLGSGMPGYGGGTLGTGYGDALGATGGSGSGGMDSGTAGAGSAGGGYGGELGVGYGL